MSGALLEAPVKKIQRRHTVHWLWPRWDPPWAKQSTRKFARRRSELPGSQGYCRLLEVCGLHILSMLICNRTAWTCSSACWNVAYVPPKSNGLWLLHSWFGMIQFFARTSVDPVHQLFVHQLYACIHMHSSSCLPAGGLDFRSFLHQTHWASVLDTASHWSCRSCWISSPSRHIAPVLHGCHRFFHSVTRISLVVRWFSSLLVIFSYHVLSAHQSECFKQCTAVQVWVVANAIF